MVRPEVFSRKGAKGAKFTLDFLQKSSLCKVKPFENTLPKSLLQEVYSASLIFSDFLERRSNFA
jgi:hypothetical protein